MEENHWTNQYRNRRQQASSRTKQLGLIKTTYSDISSLWKCKIDAGKYADILLSCLDYGFKERNIEITKIFQDAVSQSQNASGNIPASAGISFLFNVASEQIKTLGLMLKEKKNKKQIQAQSKKAKPVDKDVFCRDNSWLKQCGGSV